jgi:hypothetical protein
MTKLIFSYWGWGGEDDDLAKRLRAEELPRNFLPRNIGRFKVSQKVDKSNTYR